MHRLRSTLALGLAVTSAAAQKPASVAEQVAAAEALAGKQPDRACLALRRAHAHPDATAAELRQIDRLLRDLDPRAGQHKQAYAAAARTLIRHADGLARLKWHRLALHTLWRAELFDRAQAAYPLKRLTRAAPREVAAMTRARERAARAATVREPDLVVFDPGGVAHYRWKIDGDQVRSMRLGENVGSPYILFRKPSHEDCLLSVEVKRTAGASQAAMLFGGLGHGDYFLFELEYFAGGRAIAAIYEQKASKIEQLLVKECPMTEMERGDWVILAVRVEGRRARLYVNGREQLSIELSRVAHGMTGLHVNGTSKWKEPVSFRRLRIEPLTAEPKSDPLLAALLEIPDAPAKGKEEDAALAAVEIAGELLAIEDAARRERIAARIDAVLGAHSPRHAANAKAAASAATALLGLARAYAEAGWPDSAHAIVGDACRLSEPTARAAFLESLQRRAAAAKEPAVKKPTEKKPAEKKG